jgi:hypothetical protein
MVVVVAAAAAVENVADDQLGDVLVGGSEQVDKSRAARRTDQDW